MYRERFFVIFLTNTLFESSCNICDSSVEAAEDVGGIVTSEVSMMVAAAESAGVVVGAVVLAGGGAAVFSFTFIS